MVWGRESRIGPPSHTEAILGLATELQTRKCADCTGWLRPDILHHFRRSKSTGQTLATRQSLTSPTLARRECLPLRNLRACLVCNLDGLIHRHGATDAATTRSFDKQGPPLADEHCSLPAASPTELRLVKLSFPSAPVGPSLMTQNRALHNPPIAVPSSGLPSHQSGTIDTDYLLVCEAHSRTLTDGRWRFTLEAADGEMILEADDHDTGDLNRLTLLAAVRGMESLEGPSAITLLSNNRYLIRSLSNSLPRWRQNNFMWDHFGRQIDVQHADLWRRIDHALAIHRVQACLVSSCLVSHGQAKDLGQSESAPRLVDSPENKPLLRIDRPAGGDRIESSSNPSRGVVPAPSARLRRLLSGNDGQSDGAPSARRRGRFTAEDLES